MADKTEPGYVPTVGGYPTDAYVSGDWDEVERAYYRGLISDGQFELLAKRQREGCYHVLAVYQDGAYAEEYTLTRSDIEEATEETVMTEYAQYPEGHPRHGISPTRPMQTLANRYCAPSNTDLPDIHPETGDQRCPSPGCGEYVNRECWRCGWIRVRRG